MIRRDMDEVLSIENRSFEFPWTEEEFICCLRQRNCIGTVAELDHKIVGFMIYELHKSMLLILNFAVDPDHRCSGIGTKMIERLFTKLSKQRRSQLILDIRETNLQAQIFFSMHGFIATRIKKGQFEDTSEDAYEFIYTEKGTGSEFIPDKSVVQS